MVYLDKERVTGYKSDVLKAVGKIEGIVMPVNAKEEILLQGMLEKLRKITLSNWGENLYSVVLFGSGARGDYRSTSDLDLLIVLKEAKGSLGKRLDEFLGLKQELHSSAEYKRALTASLPHNVQPVILTKAELAARPPLFLDLTTDAIIIFDRDNTFQREVERVKERLEELGAKKVNLGNGRWYRLLKPGIKKGETVNI